MHTEKIARLVRRALGCTERMRKGDELVFMCPRPESHPNKPKLSVNISTGRFHCWVCGWSGRSLLPILRSLRNDQDAEEYKESLFGLKAELVEVERRYDEVVLPESFRPLSLHSGSSRRRETLDYLYSRGVSADDIVLWKLGYCDEGPYQGRVIIPSFDQFGELNFFVGRACSSKMFLNYKHGNFNKDIIWNDYMIDWSGDVTVVEGPFDAFKVRENVVALQGSILRTGSKLFRKLVECQQTVYLALDSDAEKKQFDMADRLISFDVDVKIVPLGDRKDVGEMSVSEFRSAKSSAFSFSGLDSLRARVRNI